MRGASLGLSSFITGITMILKVHETVLQEYVVCVSEFWILMRS